jgi:hypothetical protein
MKVKIIHKYSSITDRINNYHIQAIKMTKLVGKVN